MMYYSPGSSFLFYTLLTRSLCRNLFPCRVASRAARRFGTCATRPGTSPPAPPLACATCRLSTTRFRLSLVTTCLATARLCPGGTSSSPCLGRQQRPLLARQDGPASLEHFNTRFNISGIYNFPLRFRFLPGCVLRMPFRYLLDHETCFCGVDR